MVNIKDITRLMINEFKMNKLGVDFMGYSFNKNNASFHHLLIPARKNGPMTVENGAVLNDTSSHPYLHLIETINYGAFCYITSEMVDMNIKGELNIYNLRRIKDLLLQFEEEHKYDRTKKGKILIKQEYKKRVLI